MLIIFAITVKFLRFSRLGERSSMATAKMAKLAHCARPLRVHFAPSMGDNYCTYGRHYVVYMATMKMSLSRRFFRGPFHVHNTFSIPPSVRRRHVTRRFVFFHRPIGRGLTFNVTHFQRLGIKEVLRKVSQSVFGFISIYGRFGTRRGNMIIFFYRGRILLFYSRAYSRTFVAKYEYVIEALERNLVLCGTDEPNASKTQINHNTFVHKKEMVKFA